MIYDKLSNLKNYRGMSPWLDRAIAYLSEADLAALPAGRTDVSGADVFINRFRYTTGPKTAESRFEAHERCLDLHIVLQGGERMALAPVDALHQTRRLEAEDAVLYAGEAEYTLPLRAGMFVLVAPGEGHLPRLVHESACSVDKLVCKIRTGAGQEA